MIKFFALILLFSGTCFAKSNLKLVDFFQINIGIKITDAEKIIGKPNKTVKSNINYNLYNLLDDCKMKLVYKNKKLSKMYFIDPCKREYELKTRKPSNALCYSVSNRKKLSIKDFCKITVGMKYNTIVNLIGSETRATGFGIIRPIYDFQDDSYMRLLYLNDTLIILDFVDSCGREYSLIE